MFNVLRRRTAFSTPRAPDGCVDGCVTYSDAHLKDYRLSLTYGIVCDDRPPVLLVSCENIIDTICYFFQEMWRIIEMDVERCETQHWYCESDAQVATCQEIPGVGDHYSKERSINYIKTSEKEMEVPMYMYKRRKLGF